MAVAVTWWRCGDDRREVVLGSGKEGVQVTVDGTVFTVVVEAAAPGVFVLRTGDHTSTFHCVRDQRVLHLFWKGVTYRLEEEREGAGTSRRQATGALEAPMPGKVIKVSVTPGQKVARGDEVLVVEAMKMENALRAPREGTVRSVMARVGDMVSPGVVLVELE